MINQQHQGALKCPRCESHNTKFCYYNNYNPAQPRHYCKACRRYWTKGGVLGNVPVGGGIRKSKRSNSSNFKSSPNYNSSSPPTTTTTAAAAAAADSDAAAVTKSADSNSSNQRSTTLILK